MKQKNIEIGGVLLGLVVLATVLWYGNSPGTVVFGASYLVAAACIDLFCLLVIFTVKMRMKKHSSAQSLWLLLTRAQLALLVAWQLGILGVLNIWASNLVRSATIFVLSNVLLLACVFISDRMIALSDSPDQSGGAKPLSSLGRPRSRRLFFWAFVVYPSSSLGVAGVLLFAKMKPYPFPFHPPQICLLLDAVFSAVAAGLVFQRYSGEVSNQPSHARRFLLAVLLVIGPATGFQFFVAGNLYANVLSSLTVICTAVSAHWLWRAKNSDSIVLV